MHVSVVFESNKEELFATIIFETEIVNVLKFKFLSDTTSKNLKVKLGGNASILYC